MVFRIIRFLEENEQDDVYQKLLLSAPEKNSIELN